jgi:ABC-type cobalamin/Fe3+-siderophores transport system ATPase subunit
MTLKSITFKNYRSFGRSGAEIPLNDEFVGIVGVNNAGKSTLLRAFYELRPVFAMLAGMRLGNESLRGALMARGDGPSVSLALSSGEQIAPKNGTPDDLPTIILKFERDPGGVSSLIEELAIEIVDGTVIRLTIRPTSGEDILREDVNEARPVPGPENQGPLLEIHYGGGTRSVRVNWDEIIPDLSRLARSLYVGAFRNAINSGGSDYYDLSIGRDFIERFKNYRSGPIPNENESIQQMADAIAEIFGFERMEVNPASDGSHLRYLIDGGSFRDSELGAGIAQFVIVAANVLVNRPNILLIDEPELNLHASLQLRFLTLLAKYVSGPVIFASHSLGLTRAAADRVFVASRDKSGHSILNDYQESINLSLTLGELGYGGLHDATFKAVLLVEGVTEVRALQELLVKYGVRNQVVIVQLGGDTMAVGGRAQELAELRRLSDHVYAIVDSERETPGSPAASRRLAFAKDCAEQGIECLVLERRAIENYLNHDASDRAMNIVGSAGLGPFDAPILGWSKGANWRAVQAIPKVHFDGTDLGNLVSKIATFVLAE